MTSGMTPEAGGFLARLAFFTARSSSNPNTETNP
jgi:hypothetical protein